MVLDLHTFFLGLLNNTKLAKLSCNKKAELGNARENGRVQVPSKFCPVIYLMKPSVSSATNPNSALLTCCWQPFLFV
jgi:hypothetical protein